MMKILNNWVTYTTHVSIIPYNINPKTYLICILEICFDGSISVLYISTLSLFSCMYITVLYHSCHVCEYPTKVVYFNKAYKYVCVSFTNVSIRYMKLLIPTSRTIPHTLITKELFRNLKCDALHRK